MSARSSKRSCSASAVAMYSRKPRAWASIADPLAVRAGIRRARTNSSTPISVTALEQPAVEQPLVLHQVSLAVRQLHEQPVAGPEEPLARLLLDPQVPADRQVDDRRRDVEDVGPLVEQRPELTRPQPVGRRELHGHRAGPDDRHRLLLGAALADQAGRDAGEPAVAALRGDQ